MSKIKLAALQLELEKTNNLNYLLDELNQLCKNSNDLDLVILSELAVGGAGAKNCDHPFKKYKKVFSDFAIKNSIFLIPGTFYEEINGKNFNVSPVFNRNGELIAKAKKIYPWLPYEQDVESSSEICVFNFEGKGNIGIHICYDLWFPETSRALAMAGAEIIINPTMTPTKDRDIETIMVRATAAQQQCFYIDINGSGDISGDLSVGGVLTYEDVTSIDSVGIITARDGIHVGAGVSAVGVGTFSGLDISGDIDVDGHTELDNVNIAGVTTFASSIHVADSIIHQGDTDTKIDFAGNQVKLTANNRLRIDLASNNYNYFYGTQLIEANSTYPKTNADYIARFRDTTGDDTSIWFHNTDAKNTVIRWNDTGNSTSAGNLIFTSLNTGYEEHARFTGAGNFNLLKDLDVDDVNINGSTVSTTSSNTDLTLSPNGTGTVKVPSGYVDRSGYSALSLATKGYVDSVKQALDIKDAVKAASVSNFAASRSGSVLTASGNGAFTLDGVTLAASDRVLMKNQSTAADNGIYTVTTVGDGSTAADKDTLQC